MNGRRIETRYHTDEQVREAIEKGVALVDELDVPSDLRPLAFGKAVELYVAKNIAIEQIAPGLGGLAIPSG